MTGLPPAADAGERQGGGRWPPSLQGDRQALIDGLNHDLAGEYQAVLMYTHYAARLTGPYSRELRSLFRAGAADELGHAQFLADKVASLGGKPATQPRPVPAADGVRAMLEHARAAEARAVEDYGARARQAKAAGEIGLKVALESVLADETRHLEEVERILAGWEEAAPGPDGAVDRWRDDGGRG